MWNKPVRSTLISIILACSLSGCSSVPIDSTNMPADVPLRTYPNAKPNQYQQFLGQTTIGYLTSSNPKSVTQWYLDEMRTNGWNITGQVSKDHIETISAVKGNTKVLISISAIPPRYKESLIAVGWKRQ